VVATFSDPKLCHGNWFWSKVFLHFPGAIPPGEVQDDNWSLSPTSALCRST